MSMLLIGSGLLALGSLGASYALRRLRRGASAPAVAISPREAEANACPVCLARARGQEKIHQKTVPKP